MYICIYIHICRFIHKIIIIHFKRKKELKEKEMKIRIINKKKRKRCGRPPSAAAHGTANYDICGGDLSAISDKPYGICVIDVQVI